MGFTMLMMQFLKLQPQKWKNL